MRNRSQMQKTKNLSRTAKVILINLALIFVVGLTFEIGYRLANPGSHFYSRTYPGHNEDGPVAWARVDKELGWVFGGNHLNSFSNPAYGEESWSATVNPQGFRDDVDFDRIKTKDPGVTRIMILGDSFAFGTYVQDSETLAANLRMKLGKRHEIYNLSVPGWGVDQMYLAYRKYEERIAPDIVVLGYIDDDLLRVYEAFRRAEKLSKPSFKLVAGELVPRTTEGHEWLDLIAQSSLFLNDYYAGSIRYKRCEKIGKAIFADLAEHTSQKGRQFIVVRYPTQFEFRRKKKRRPFPLDRFLADRNVTHIDTFDGIRAKLGAEWEEFFLEKDGHPSSAGHALVADLLILELSQP